MHRSPTRHPFPSTTELVASVEERDARETCGRMSASRPRRDSLMPLERSSLVVSALLPQTTFPDPRSTTTVSVYVPPASIPSP